MSQSAYEIRCNLLHMAKEILNKKTDITNEAISLNNRYDLENGNSKNIFFVSPPTTEEILVEAEKLNSFVSDDNVDSP